MADGLAVGGARASAKRTRQVVASVHPRVVTAPNRIQAFRKIRPTATHRSRTTPSVVDVRGRTRPRYR